MSHIAYFSYNNWYLKLIANAQGLISIHFMRSVDPVKAKAKITDPVLKDAVQQLKEYFDGRRTEFNLPLSIEAGTEFQKQVWERLQSIPYGTVTTYQDVAISLGKPKAMRAVGGANNKNPLPIVIPCHRVVGKDGSMIGFAPGTKLKERLLKLEGLTP